MTTGRINQITIPYRGEAVRRREGAGEMSFLGGVRGRAALRALGSRRGHLARHPFSHSHFPRAPVHLAEPARGGLAWGPQEEGLRPASAIAASAGRGVLPLL